MSDMEYMVKMIRARVKDCPECGERWSWTGTVWASGVPVFRHKDKSTYPRRVLLEEKTGQPIPAGMLATTTCENELCVNPKLLVLMTRKQLIERTHQRGRIVTMAMRIKISEAKRRQSKLSDEAVRDIRSSEEHRSVLMQRYGITEAYYYMLRKGLFRKEYSNPFAGLFTGLAANDHGRKRA